jgi:hypothetical protein
MAAALPKKEPRPVYFVPVTVLILLAATLFRVWDLAEVSLWGDENLSMFRHDLSFADMMDNIAVNGTQVPLYFIVARLLPAGNPYLLRLPALFTALLSIALFIFVVYRLYGRPSLALWAGALLAFNPYHIWLSRQARFYPQLFLLALLSSFLFLYLIHRRRSLLLWLSFILVTAGAYLTHYFGIILPIAQYLYMFAAVRNDRSFLFKWFAAQGVAVAPAVAWFIHARSHAETTYAIGWIPEPALDTLPVSVANFTTGYAGTMAWYFVPLLLLAAIGLGAGVVYAIRRWKTQPVTLYWAFLLFVPPTLVYLYAAGYLAHSIYMDRYFMGVLPGAIMLMLVGWYSLSRHYRHLLAGVGAVFLLGSSIVAADAFRQNEHQLYDYRAVAAYYEDERQPGDGLLLVPPGISLVLERYTPVYEAGDTHYWAGWLVDEQSTAEIDRTLLRQATEHGQAVERVWVIYRNPEINAHRQSVQPEWDPFEPSVFAEEESAAFEWLTDHRANLIRRKDFSGIVVLLYAYEAPPLPYPAP